MDQVCYFLVKPLFIVYSFLTNPSIVYITGGLAVTLYMNTADKRAERVSQEQEDLAHSAVKAFDDKNTASKSNTDVSLFFCQPISNFFLFLFIFF